MTSSCVAKTAGDDLNAPVMGAHAHFREQNSNLVTHLIARSHVKLLGSRFGEALAQGPAPLRVKTETAFEIIVDAPEVGPDGLKGSLYVGWTGGRERLRDGLGCSGRHKVTDVAAIGVRQKVVLDNY